MATLGPSLSISVNLYTVCGLLFTGRRPGEASPGQWLAGEEEEFRSVKEVWWPLLPCGLGVSAPCAQGPSLKAWTDGFANPRWVWPEHPKPLPTDLPGLGPSDHASASLSGTNPSEEVPLLLRR